MPELLTKSLADQSQELLQLRPVERIAWLFDQVPHDEILITTSLGTTSALLLHMVHQVAPQHPINYVDTGYLFPQTIAFGKKLAADWGLNLQRVTPDLASHAFTRREELFRRDADTCCAINKVAPVNQLKEGKSVWLSGLLRFQNANRAQLGLFQKHGSLSKMYPILDMTEEEVALYQLLYELPSHPLLDEGYASVGCTHCTQKGLGREGRWAGQKKTECGLHG